MKFIRQRLAIILVIVFIVIFGEMALGNAIAKSQVLIQPSREITEEFKNIPYNPNSTQEQNINEFAWKDFVALNWPSDCQGNPLEDKRIGEAPQAPRIWELYPSPQDVFLPDGVAPPSQSPENKKCLGDRKGSEIEYNQNLRLTKAGELVGTQKFEEVKTASKTDLLDGYGELNSEISVDLINETIKIPLVDRQGNYVINEIRLNPVEYDEIINKEWYDANKLVEFIEANKQFNLTCSKGYETEKSYCSEGAKNEGAIEIKAVWRVFDERNSPEEKARYYTTTRKIVIPDESLPGKYKILQEAELGLIGFHIMHKTSQLGWVWSTFEHIDNAPSCDDSKTKLYTLYNKDCNTGNCQENFPYVKEPYLWRLTNNEPKAITIAGIEGIAVRDKKIEIKEQIPAQICHSNQIRQSVTQENEEWQNSLTNIAESSLWQYYELIGVQWLQNPGIPYSSEGVNRRRIQPPIALTNTALEPYVQGVSCIVCHTSAHLPGQGNFCELMVQQGEEDKIKACADFSFLMDNAQFGKQTAVYQK
ncbi:MAG: hypothetical protein SAL07_01405 [Oscillatoria sp. PMC 1051.18]|nr:hypothetical protein [Oscillatoria sp. PMC 1050.18]MEC5028540.1 hypothetical protein [Oscillatoria sp. PMC 1051.18]